MAALRWVLVWSAALATGACSGPTPEVPEPRAASSARAQKELRALEAEWEVGSRLDRQTLRPRLEQFVRTHATDPSVARARLLLARIALTEDRLGAAEQLLEPVLDGPESRTRDEAIIVRAGIESRRGQHERALQLLDPLAGKVLTDEAQYEYSRRRVMAALGARRWRLAVRAMTIWVAHADQRRTDAKDWTRRSIDQVPTRALARILADWPSEPPGRAEPWMQRTIIEHLTDKALQNRDARLARDLLETSPTWLRASEAGEELALLAALAQEEARISGRLVGVVVGGEDRQARVRSIQVAAGLVRGLGLGKGSDERAGVRLLAEDERGAVGTALASLMGNGAGLLVAGVTRHQAAEALRFAELRQVPVITLVDPGPAWQPEQFGFVLGSDQSQQVDAIEDAAEQWGGASGRVLFLGDGRTDCRPAWTALTASRFPLQRWRDEGVGALGILGGASCARAVQAAVRATDWDVPIVLGLEAAAGPLGQGTTLLSVAAGSFPSERAWLASDQFSQDEDETYQSPPGWYSVLGEDAARLASRALANAPASATQQAELVKERHRQVRDALLTAEASLASTAAGGFAGAYRIPRQLTVERVPAERVPGRKTE